MPVVVEDVLPAIRAEKDMGRHYAFRGPDGETFDGPAVAFFTSCLPTSHNLTVGMRAVWSDDDLDDAEKLDRMKWVNELLHRVTAKIYVLRLKTHEWTEADFGELIDGYMRSHPGIASIVEGAVGYSYRSVANAEME
jgi:hypothetical protein